MANYQLGPAHWLPGSTVTWHYAGTASAVFAAQANAGYPTPDLFPVDIVAAFTKWDVQSAGITFQQVASAAAANIVLSWSPIDGTSGIVGQASYSYNPATQLIVSQVQIKFDLAELYNPTSGSEKLAASGGTFFSIALHEIGHAIGIDHYTAGLAIMNPFVNPSLNDLTESDIAAIQAIYGGAGTVSGQIVWDFNWKLASVGDYNSDGTTDAIWINSNGVLGGWLMQNGVIGGTLDLPFFPSFTAIGSGDFNGDGVDDVLWRRSDGLIAEWFMGEGTRQGTAHVQYMPGWEMLATGDFNGDGTTDLLWRNANGVLGSWLMKDGQIAGTLDVPIFPGWNIVASGDFNGDGVDDLLWQSSAGHVGEWLMGDGTRAATFLLNSMAGWTALGGGDFNNDGLGDVLWRDAGGVTVVWLMNNGAVQQQTYVGNSSALNFQAIGDFNGDGFDDIMWQDKSTGNVSFWKMGAGGVVVSATNPIVEESQIASGLATGELAFANDTFDFLPFDKMPLASAPLEAFDIHPSDTLYHLDLNHLGLTTYSEIV